MMHDVFFVIASGGGSRGTFVASKRAPDRSMARPFAYALAGAGVLVAVWTVLTLALGALRILGRAPSASPTELTVPAFSGHWDMKSNEVIWTPLSLISMRKIANHGERLRLKLFLHSRHYTSKSL